MTDLKLALIISTVFKGADAFNKADGGLKGFGSAISKVSAQLKGLAVLAAFSFLKESIQLWGNYSNQMQAVQATTGATSGEFAQLDGLAKKLGATMGAFTATEAAESMKILSFAGFEVNEVLISTPQVLKLAQIGMMSMSEAANFSANVLRGFGLDAENMAHVVDVMALAFTSSNVTMGELAQSMSYIAPIARNAGISLEEVAAVIGILGNAGIKGSRSGVMLRQILLSLQAPSGGAAAMIDKLNIELFVLDGAARDVQTTLRQNRIRLDETKMATEDLENATKDLDDAMSKLALDQKKNSLEIMKIRNDAMESNRELTASEERKIRSLEIQNNRLRESETELSIERDEARIVIEENTRSMDTQKETIKENEAEFNSLKGELLPLSEIVRNFTTAMEDLSVAEETQSLRTIFNVRSLAAMQVMMSATIEAYGTGSDAIAGFTEDLENSAGVADKTFKIMEDGAGLRMKKFTSAVEALQISIGEALFPALEELMPIMEEDLFPLIQEVGIPLFVAFATAIIDISRAIRPLTKWINEHEGAVELLMYSYIGLKGAMGILSLIKAVEGGMIALGISTKVTTGLQWNLNFAMLANPIGATVLALVALIAIFAIMWVWYDDLVNITNKLTGGNQALSKILLFLIGGPLWSIIIIIKEWNDIMSILGNMFEWFGEIARNVLLSVGDSIFWLGDKITGFWITVGNVFTDMVDSAFDWGKDLLDNFIDGMLKPFHRLENVLSKIGGSIGNVMDYDKPSNDRQKVKEGSDMMEFFTQGITSALPQLFNTLGAISTGMEMTIMPQPIGYGVNVPLTSPSTTQTIDSHDTIKVEINVKSLDNNTDIEKLGDKIAEDVNRKKKRGLGNIGR